MHTANLRSSRPVTVLGTVMGIVRDGNWVIHRVEATRPDGRRFTLEVVDRQRHTGSVAVRWDPAGVAEPRFLSRRPWGLYTLAAAIVVVVAVVAWLVVL